MPTGGKPTGGVPHGGREPRVVHPIPGGGGSTTGLSKGQMAGVGAVLGGAGAIAVPFIKKTVDAHKDAKQATAIRRAKKGGPRKSVVKSTGSK